MIYKRPIAIEKLNLSTEEWESYLPLLHANVNKNRQDNEYLQAGALQSQAQKVFKVRYCPPLKAIDGNTQIYRILYDGRYYNIVDYDDFEERHREVKLLGVTVPNG